MVELIVVIAIIGVLAAILIPTMIGYVTRSQVGNMNAAAGKMRDNISYFMTQANADGYGMFVSHSAVCDVDITIVGGVWTVTTSDKTVFVQYFNTKWTGSGQAQYNDGSAQSNCAETRLAAKLAELFRDVTDGYVKFRLIGGVCTALYFTQEQTSAVTDMPAFGNPEPWAVETFGWNGQTQGVTPGGIIVGTSPVLMDG